MIDTCKYLGVIVVIFITLLIISRSLNWQSNILKFMTNREGFPSEEDSDEEEEEEEEFDPDDFREMAKKLLDLLEEINEKEGELYIKNTIGKNIRILRDIDYMKSLWNKPEDEWKDKAYSELAESKFVNYNKLIFKVAKNFDKTFEEAETKETSKRKYNVLKKLYGETGILYIQRATGIVLDKEMDFLSNDSGVSFF